MFTGLVAGTGQLKARDRRGPGYRLVIGTAGVPGFEALDLGESIAVNGACLTVVEWTKDTFDADVTIETADKTTLGQIPLGGDLNLERSLRVGDRLGGHWLSGHVDGVARVEKVETQGDAWLVSVAFAPEHRRFLAVKGSVALDGVSLTVNALGSTTLGVMLIPHSREVTSLKRLKVGSLLNMEVDLVARYLVSYFEATSQTAGGGGDASFALALERAGYK